MDYKIKNVFYDAKEMAEYLVDKFSIIGLQQRNEGIQCAILCVEEIMDEIPRIVKINDDYDFAWNKRFKYWEDVINEIEKLKDKI